MAGTSEKLGLNEDDVKNRNEEEGGGVANLLKLMSDDEDAAIALADSIDGRIMDRRLSIMAMPEDSEAEIQYWENFAKGLHKEMHDSGLEKWSSFIPLSYYHNKDRRYPLIFCLHGAHNPIQMAESYGIVQVAAREECIVICPENENWASIDRLLAIAKEDYPVDWSRVYACGYSFGGFSSSRIGLAHPEIFAAIGMGGMLFANDVKGHDLDGQWYEEYRLTDEMTDKARELGLGICLIMGEHEMLGLLPIQNMPDEGVQEGVIPLKPDEKKASFNNFRKAAGCCPAEFPEGQDQRDDVERMTGIRFEKTEIREYNERRYLYGYSIREDGYCDFETVAVEGMVHWPSSMFGEIIWSHLRKFAKDTETGKLIRR